MIKRNYWCNYDGEVSTVEYYDTETNKKIVEHIDYGILSGGTEEELKEMIEKYNQQEYIKVVNI